MNLPKIPDAKEIIEVRKSKGLSIETQEELLGIFVSEFGKAIANGIKNLKKSTRSMTEIGIRGKMKNCVTDQKPKEEGVLQYIAGHDKTVDAAVEFLQSKGYKVSFYARKYEAGDRSGDTRREMGIFMGISL